MSKSKKWASKDREALLHYNGLDTIATAIAFRRLRGECQTPRQNALYAHSKAMSVLAGKLHDTGLYMHQDERRAQSAQMTTKIALAAEALQTMVAVEGFRSTPNDMRALLFKRHATAKISRFNLPDPIDEKLWSSKDTISVDGATLMSLLINPGIPELAKGVINAYWSLEELKKAKSTFIDSDLVTQALGRDSRVRAGWNSLGAQTGRWTCSQPNLLTVPGYLRGIYGAAPGKVLVYADHSQQELRVLQAVSGDKELGRRLATGDVYTADAIDWYGLPPETTKKTIKDEIRQGCKQTHLASQYGAGTKKVYQLVLEQLRTAKYRQVEILHKKFKSSYADTVTYWQAEAARVAQTGFSESRILGRRRYYPRYPDLPEMANYPIQATAADLFNSIILELDRRLNDVPGASIVVPFYDAVTSECREEDLPRVAALTEECMTAPFTFIDGLVLSVPTGGIKAGTAWFECKHKGSKYGDNCCLGLKPYAF